MKALIIVDVQNDFLPGGALGVPLGDEVIPAINAIQADFDLVVATQDWHPAEHGSFASIHPGTQPLQVIDLNGISQVLWPDHCVQDTHGAALVSELDQQRVAAIFRKGMDPMVDSYSGFYDNWRLHSTGLGDYLKGKGVKGVSVCGLAADYCVFYTARNAIELGFETEILTFATRPIDPQGWGEVRCAFVSLGGSLRESYAGSW
jgi:nicotinamidase/pyrazinamidase